MAQVVWESCKLAQIVSDWCNVAKFQMLNWLFELAS